MALIEHNPTVPLVETLLSTLDKLAFQGPSLVTLTDTQAVVDNLLRILIVLQVCDQPQRSGGGGAICRRGGQVTSSRCTGGWAHL